MLTADLVRPRLYTRKGELLIRWLPAKGEALEAAGDLIRLFGKGLGKPMREWSAALEAYEGARTDYTILRGLAKVLEDGATFTPVETPVDPVALRQAVFAHGPVFSHADLFRKTRPDALGEAGAALGLTLEQMEAALYADRTAEYLLSDLGPAWTPESLIARYNLELARAALYWATELRIDIHDGYKDFWHFLKLFKLMFWATPLPEGGYHVSLDGPISPFVHSTTRYGRQFAVFLPALLLGQQWSMVADVRLPGESKTLYYRLDATTPLKTHFKGGGEFDSRMEADFAAEFEAKFGGERGGWTLKREDEVLLLGDTVMIPDFSVTNKADGRRR